MSSPDNEQHYNSPDFPIEGLIRLKISEHDSYTVFDNDEYTLTIDCQDRIYPCASGSINQMIRIKSGINFIQFRATSLSGNTGYKNFVVYGDF